jgi:predicted CXXCH cytochrome family protein
MVTAGGKERIMVQAQTSGDCNSCHSESGSKDAPGRIVAP